MDITKKIFFLVILFLLWSACKKDITSKVSLTAPQKQEIKLLREYPYLKQRINQLKWEIYLNHHNGFFREPLYFLDGECKGSFFKKPSAPIRHDLMLYSVWAYPDGVTQKEMYSLSFLFVEGEKWLCQKQESISSIAFVSRDTTNITYLTGGMDIGNDLWFSSYKRLLPNNWPRVSACDFEGRYDASRVQKCLEPIFLRYILQNPDSVNTWLRGEARKRLLRQIWRKKSI